MPYPAVPNTQMAVIAHGLGDQTQIETFVKHLVSTIQRGIRLAAQNKTVNVVVSVVTGEEKFGPMVDVAWACAALPCSKSMLSHYLQRAKPRLDPPVYRRIVRPDGRNQRIRLLSLHDLRVLRGCLLSRTPGKELLRQRGDIA